MPIVADAAVAIRGDLSKFNQDIKTGGEKGARSLASSFKNALSPKNLAIAGVGVGLAIGGAIIAGLADATRALIDIERLNAQTDAAIRSTGGAAQVTRQHVEDMAEAAEKTTTIQRESVQEAANLLLTFTNIRNEAGEGNDIFDEATESVLDMSVAMGTDARTAAMQLGKALNDPLQGMKQLGRAGVQFTDEQEALIRSLVETGDLLGAQKVILEELETQFGGSAEAFADTTAGKIQRFQNEMGNMFESIILGAVKVGEEIDESFKNSGVDEFAMNFGDQGDRVHQIADSMGEDFDELKDRIATRMHENGETFEEAADKVESELAEMSAEAFYQYAQVSTAAAEGLQAAQETSRFEARILSGIVPEEIANRWEDTRDAAFQMAVEHAKGILDGQNQVKVAFEVLTQLQEEEQTKAQRISYLMGLLSSTELRDGLNDGRPGVRGAANALRGQIVAELASLGVDGYQWGQNLVNSITAGMYSRVPDASESAYAIGGAIRAGVGINSEPTDPNSPLRGITRWGGNIVDTIAQGIYGNLGSAAGATHALAGALVPSLGVPALAGAAGGVMTGNTYILQVDGTDKVVGTREEVLDAWAQMEQF